MAAFDCSEVHYNNKIEDKPDNKNVKKHIFVHWIWLCHGHLCFSYKNLPGQQNMLSFVFERNKVGRRLTSCGVSYLRNPAM